MTAIPLAAYCTTIPSQNGRLVQFWSDDPEDISEMDKYYRDIQIAEMMRPAPPGPLLAGLPGSPYAHQPLFNFIVNPYSL